MDVPFSDKHIKGSFLGRGNFNLKTVALLPISSSVPITAFAKKLYAALEGIGAPTAYLDQTSVMSHVGRHAFTRMGNLKVAGWLAEQEQRYRIVLYIADTPVGSQWTQTCIRQVSGTDLFLWYSAINEPANFCKADYVMVVGLADDGPGVGDYEKMLLSSKTTARKELVILHSDRSVAPGGVTEWLRVSDVMSIFLYPKSLTFTNRIVHGLTLTTMLNCQCVVSFSLTERDFQHIIVAQGLVSSKPSHPPPLSDPAAVKALKKMKDRVQIEIQKYRGSRSAIRPPRPDHASDFARLARRLCGRTIGVVFGGGGARGLSHLVRCLFTLSDAGIHSLI
jgi:lysophospholipid hydrolase